MPSSNMPASMAAVTVTVARVGPGTFLVSGGDQRHVVHAAGPPHDLPLCGRVPSRPFPVYCQRPNAFPLWGSGRPLAA